MSSKYEFLESIKFIHEYDFDPIGFQIYLVGREDPGMETMEFGEPGVEFRMANRFIKNLDTLNNIDPKRPILVALKTCGGDVVEGMAIYDAIMACSNPVTMVNYTHARSMSSIILQAANKRIMMPNSHFMFHMGETGASGTTKQFYAYADFARKEFDSGMIPIYADRMKHTPDSKVHSWREDRIHKWLKEQMDKREDVYLNANETVQWGFADEVFSDWDTVFDYTPQQKGIK
jgi:ATP-dependent protease ClpP protease subunit